MLNMGSVPTFSIELPKRKLPTLLASTSTATKSSIRQELKLTSTILKAGEVQMGDISQSASTIYRQRRSAVKEASKSLKANIVTRAGTQRFLVVNYDGKIVQAKLYCGLIIQQPYFRKYHIKIQYT